VDTTVADPLVGRLLDGRYRVEARLARGGMATVYEAVDIRLERPVALKVMHAGLAEDQAFVARFIREARSAARLSDPGVVAVYDQGQDDGTVFLAMEYVPGRTLRDLIRARGRLTPREALDVLEPVLSALAAAHRAGLVHRDVKPENVLLGDDGRIRVADFGLARNALASGGSSATQGVIMGTVAYLAPELVERGVADPRSDVYSCGILLYEMLTGSPPYSGETPMSVAYQHVTSDVPPPSRALPGLAPGLDVLVRAATDRDPDGRPADAGAMLRELQQLRAALTPAELAFAPGTVDLTQTLVVPLPGTGTGRGAAAAGVTAGGSAAGARPFASAPPPGGPPRQADPGLDSRPQPGRSRRGAIIGLLVLALVAATVGGVAWYLGSGRWTTTPSVVGLDQAKADQTLEAAGLRVGEAPPQFSETVKAGLVISTDPGPRQRVATGGTVTLTLSRGPERHTVPRLPGLSVADAQAALAAQALTLGAQHTAYSDTVKSGLVISSDPAAGTALKRGAAVSVVVSKGVSPATVPSFVGLPLAQAQTLAQARNLQLAQAPQGVNSTTVPAGSVVSQSVSAGTQVPRQTTVTVVVSLGPPLVQVPDVVFMSKSKATSMLKAAGFKVALSYALGGRPLNIVRSQDPAGGSLAPQGSTITLVIV
jgi:eukaryotic-like serine/threonine-protein kinase